MVRRYLVRYTIKWPEKTDQLGGSFIMKEYANAPTGDSVHDCRIAHAKLLAYSRHPSHQMTHTTCEVIIMDAAYEIEEAENHERT